MSDNTRWKVSEEKKEAVYGRGPIPRDSYLPPEVRGTAPILPEDTDLAIWKFENDRGGICAIAFAGKQNKPLWYNSFRSESQRDHKIEETIRGRKQTLDFKEKRQQERREFKHEFNVGDILYASWGYDQTNIDYYQVITILGPSMVAIREIGKDIDHSNGHTDYVVPVPNHFTGPLLRKKVSPGHYVRLNSFSSASKWDGTPKGETGAGYGH
jgi:hypothetical protein